MGESQANGLAEAGIRSVEGQVRVLKAALEGRYNLTAHHSEHVMAWLVDHAATLLYRYGPGRDGKSPYHLLKGKPPSQPIAEFGECVLYRPHKGAHVAGKLNDRLKEGVWLGISARSGEHFIGTPQGAVGARARKPRVNPTIIPLRNPAAYQSL